MTDADEQAKLAADAPRAFLTGQILAVMEQEGLRQRREGNAAGYREGLLCAIRIAEDCLILKGRYRDDHDIGVFRHGIGTVLTALRRTQDTIAEDCRGKEATDAE